MKDRIDEHIEFHEANDKHKSDVEFLKNVNLHIHKLEEKSKQEVNEGNIAQALDRVNIIIGMVDDLLTDHPGIEKTGQVLQTQQVSDSLMEAYQNIGGYGEEV